MTTPARITEIVRFRLVPGTDLATLARAAEGVSQWLASRPGYLRRSLSQGPDGLFSDVVHWTDRHAAEGAAAEMMTAPAARAFLALIDPATVEMRHEAVLVTSP